MDSLDFFIPSGEMISAICSMVTLVYVIGNSSKHDKNVEKAFNTFNGYWSTVYSQQQEKFKQNEELFYQSIKPRYDVERSYYKGYLSTGDYKIEISFQNKGLGNACNTYVKMIIKADAPYGETDLKRREPAGKNVIATGETIKFCFSCGDGVLSQCNEASVSLSFEDLAGRKYRQQFDLYLHDNGQIQLKAASDVVMM